MNPQNTSWAIGLSALVATSALAEESKSKAPPPSGDDLVSVETLIYRLDPVVVENFDDWLGEFEKPPRFSKPIN